MVMPSPFQRMLQEATEMANRDPGAAFAQLDELYGKSLTDLDVRHLGAISAHIGGTMLGRWDETVAFLERCLQHPALEAGEESERSLNRALAVIFACAGDAEREAAAVERGVRSRTDRCRIAIMTAQMLVARNRNKDALPYLERAAEAAVDVPVGDEVLEQLAVIANNLLRHAERQQRAARELLLASSDALVAALQQHDDWRERHKSRFHRGRALVLAGRPAEALQLVQELMAEEEGQDAGPEIRFHSAALACRAQILRGQFKVARGALRAARMYAAQVGTEQRKALSAVLDELDAELSQGTQAISKSVATSAAS